VEKIEERPEAIEPIGECGLPREFDPLVASINSLVLRLRKCRVTEVSS